MERENIVSQLEAARFYLLCVFAERHDSATEGTTVAIASAAYYLNAAFEQIKRFSQSSSVLDEQWLLALGYRVASYFDLLLPGEIRRHLRSETNANLSQFLFNAPEVQFQTVLRLYDDFPVRQTLYRSHYEAVQEESVMGRAPVLREKPPVIHDLGVAGTTTHTKEKPTASGL